MDKKELLTLWCEFGIERENDIFEIIPEMKEAQGIKTDDSDLDLFQHSIYTFLSINRSELYIKLACLLHDIGKIKINKKTKDGKIDYNGHHIQSAEITEDILKRLDFEDGIINKTLFLILSHEKDWNNPSSKQVKRFVKLLKENNLTFEEYYDFLVANLASKTFDVILSRLFKLNVLLHQYLYTYNLPKKHIDYNSLNFSKEDIRNDIRLSSIKMDSFLLKEVYGFANKYAINNKFIFYKYLYEKYL